MGSKDSKYQKDQPKKRPTLRARDLKFLAQQTGLKEIQIMMIFEKFFQNNEHCEFSKEDFIVLYVELRPEPTDQIEEIAEYVFNAFDTDKNGMISFNEFLMGYAMTSRGDQKEKLSYAFDLYDLDNSGNIDVDELNLIIYAMFGMLGTDKDKSHSLNLAQLCLKQLDKSGDGKISKEEFIGGLLENYSIRILMSPFN